MPQSLPWPLHPLLAQTALELRARVRQWWRRPGESLFHGLALSALAALAVVLLQSQAARLLPVLDLWRAQPMAACTLFGLLALWRMHRRAVRFEAASHALGWWAALPIAPALQRRGLAEQLVLGIAVGALWVTALAAAAGLAGLFTASDARVFLLQTLVALSLGGGLVFLLRGRAGVSKRGAAAPSMTDSSAPLRSEVRGWSVAPGWLGPWPELGQLQRRQAQRAWRGGRAWVWFLPLGLLVLAGEGARVMAGMLVLVVMLPWLRTLMDASARALAEAERLLLATPRTRVALRASGWRYPASRTLLATGVFALALALFGASPLVIAFGALGFSLICGLEIALMLHYPRSRARQRGQLMAEVALLLVLAREGLGPAVLLVAVGLIAWHAWRARRLP
jgi:hypothetical protein